MFSKRISLLATNIFERTPDGWRMVHHHASGSDAGGDRAAILYSVVATCKAHGIDPWAYLRDVFERTPTHPNRRRAELLPRHWKVAHTVAEP